MIVHGRSASGLGAARRTLWLAIVAGLASTAILVGVVLAHERRDIQIRLDRAGADLIHSVSHAIQEGQEHARALSGLVQASDEVTPMEFERFAVLEGAGRSLVTVGYRPIGSDSSSLTFFYVDQDPYEAALSGIAPQLRAAGDSSSVGPVAGASDSLILTTSPVFGPDSTRVIGTSYAVVDLSPVLEAPSFATFDVDVAPDSLANLSEVPFGAWRANHVVDAEAWSFEVVDPSARSSLAIPGLVAMAVGLVCTTLAAGWVYLYTSRRLTEQAFEDLKRTARDKDRFMASVSHELRTPLTSVVGLAGVLQATWTELDRPEVQRFLEDIHDESVDLADLVEDLLTIGRDESGVLTYELTEVDVELETARVVKRLARKSSVELRVASPLGTVVADPLRFRQIARNLLVNACRHAETFVAVAVDEEGPRRVLRITNDGQGIPASEASRLFQPYQAGLREGQPGSIGLGLYVSRRLARGMGGDLVHIPHENLVVFELHLPRSDRIESGVGRRSGHRQQR